MGRITVFGGPERRRRWSAEEQRRILEEAFAPGACVAQVARRHDVSTALVYNWRLKLIFTATPSISSSTALAFERRRFFGRWIAGGNSSAATAST